MERRVVETGLREGEMIEVLREVIAADGTVAHAELVPEIAQEPDYEAAFSSLKEGVEMIYAKMMDEFRRMGVEPIDAEGEPLESPPRRSERLLVYSAQHEVTLSFEEVNR